MANAEMIKAYREKHGVSLMEAQAHYKRLELVRKIKRAETVDDLKDCMLQILGEL